MTEYIVSIWGFAWLIRWVLDLMIKFTWPLYNWSQQFTNLYLTRHHLLRLDTPLELLWLDWTEPSVIICFLLYSLGWTIAQKTHPLPSNGCMRTHIKNTACNTCSVVVCIGWKWVYSIVGCVFVVGLFTESFPSNGSTCHNMKDKIIELEKCCNNKKIRDLYSVIINVRGVTKLELAW
jgi:hypothetical protein